MKNHQRFLYGFIVFVFLFVSVSPLSAEEPKAKNIILMIGDGMGPNQLLLYNYYSKLVLKREPAFTQVMNAGHTGWMLTYSTSGLITDSAAGATAFACGIKTLNGACGVDPDGNAVTTILDIAKKYGKKTGIIATIPPFDATESAFTAHVKSRKDFKEIIDWTFQFSRPDIIMGADAAEWNDYYDIDQTSANTIAAENHYRVLTQPKELDSIQAGEKIYGDFKVRTPYQDFPAPENRDSVTLSEMTHSALDYLSQSEKGFFLMVEGSAIDLQSHANDAGGVLRETADFDRAIATAFDFSRVHSDTLLLITADHETGGMAIIYGATEAHLIAVGEQRESLKSVQKRLGKTPTLEAVQKAFSDATQIKLSREESETILKAWESGPEKVWGTVLQKYYKVGFLYNSHTSTPVALIGYGPGSKACNGWRENTDVFSIMLNATGMMR